MHNTRTGESGLVNKMASEIDEIRQRKMAEMMKGSKGSGSDGWPGEPVELTDQSFDDFVKKYPKVVVDCWAPWCGPCRMLSPTIDTIAKDMKGKIAFGKVNTDDNSQVSSKFKIMSIPTLLFFKDGQLVDKMIGAAPRAVVEQAIRKALG